MRFSIIIPVYNVEKYIDKCMYTVMHQTFDDYEVIVVNDETPDNSMEIVQRYVDAYPGKIQVIHQKNTRQGGARNRGVKAARGEYILFVDSDDYVALNMLETVDLYLKENVCDILIFRHVPVSEQGVLLPFIEHNAIAPGIYFPAKDTNMVLLPTGPVNKAFRREFYINTGFSFPEKLLYEDSVTRLLYAVAKTIVVTDNILYYYVQSENSSMRQDISEKMMDIITMTDIVIEEFKKRDLYADFQNPLECSLVFGVLCIFDLINFQAPHHPLQIPIADYMKSRFADYHENPYFSKTLKKAMDYLCKHKFGQYHYKILVWGRMKERILTNPVMAQLNNIRKRYLTKL